MVHHVAASCCKATEYEDADMQCESLNYFDYVACAFQHLPTQVGQAGGSELECPICLEDKPTEEFTILKSCAHFFCTDCCLLVWVYSNSSSDRAVRSDASFF